MKNNTIIGIYVLYFENSNNKFYVGKSMDIHNRYYCHCRDLRNKCHHSNSLQNAYIKYKTYPTLFIMKEATSYKELNSDEIYYIKELDSFISGYNETGGGEGAGYGFTSPSAVLAEEDYISILFMLTHTDMSKTQIANELEVSKHIVTSISLRQSHQHLKLEYPEEYKILEDKFGSHSTTRIHEKQVYVNILLDLAKTNDRFMDIASRYGVTDGIVEDISRGATHKYLRQSHPVEYALMLGKKGSRRCYSTNRVIGYPPVVSPEGIVYYIDSNAKAFAAKHGLHQGHFAELLRGTAKSHKGWVLASIS